MKKHISFLLIICLLFFQYTPVAFADTHQYFSFSAAQSEIFPSGTVRIRLSADADKLSDGDIVAAFRVRLQYDSARLHFLRTETSDQLQSGSLQSYSDGEQVTSVYACDGITAPRLRGNCITFVFSVPEDALPGQTTVQAQIDQSADWNEQLVPQYDRSESVELTILEPPSEDARLQKLVPSVGTLSPAFSPEVSEYSLRVSASTSSIKFQADPVDGASVKINRQSLLRAGETTDISITVTAADKKSKSQYFVSVKRSDKSTVQEFEEEEDITPEPGTVLPTESTSSSSKSSSTSKDTVSETKEARQSQASGTTSSKSTSSKSAGKSTSSVAEKENNSIPAPSVATAQPVAAGGGERNLYIVGGQTDQLPLWILAVCVSVLTTLSAINYWNARKKK